MKRPGLIGALVWVAVKASALVVVSDPDAVFKDVTSNAPWAIWEGQAAGDFNGDGRADLAVSRPVLGSFAIDVISGTRWNGEQTFDSTRIFRVTGDPGGYIYPHFAFADVNGDGRGDLVVWTKFGAAKLWVFFGRAGSGNQVDLTTQPADLEILVPGTVTAVSAGDVNGDGRPDLLLGVSTYGGGRGVCYLVLGRASFPSTVTAGDPELGPTFLGDSGNRGYLGEDVNLADVDGDGREDLLLSAPHTTFAGVERGTSYCFFASSPSAWGVWDLTTQSAPLTLSPGPSCTICRVVGAADVDGDGRADPLLFGVGGALAWVSGGSLAPGTMVVNSSVPFHPVGNISPALAGDFDGDGRADLLWHDNGVSGFGLAGWLSSDGSPTLSGGNAAFPKSAQVTTSGDFDGDGKTDLVRSFSYTLFGELREEIDITYGFRPFWNPSFSICGRAGDSNRAVLDFLPDGEAATMRIAGDVVDSINGQWIPYAPSREVTLTAPPGGKTLSVAFREKGGRESATLTQTAALQPESGAIITRNNRVQTGREGAWEVSTEGGDFLAAVYDAEGDRIRLLESDSRAAGVYTVLWDGLTASGRSAPPGVYILSIQAGKRRLRQRLLVGP